MTYLLSLDEALRIAEVATGGPVGVRDIGLVESALARRRASALGEDAHPTLDLEAAALPQSLVLDHGLVDGNERLGPACTSVLLTIAERTRPR